MTLSTSQLRASSTYAGKRVSRAQGILMEAAAHDGVGFQLNSGRRIKPEQLALVAAKGVWSPSNPHGAARYSRTAPHIRVSATGKALANHADDVNADGGHLALARYYTRQGVRVSFNVPGEPWHMDPASEAQVLAAARRLDDPWRGYPDDERRWMREFDLLERDQGTRRDDANKVHRRGVLRTVMEARRKSIWRVAQPKSDGGDGHGWGVNARAARYKSLNARR